MRILQTYSIVCVIFAICFAITAPAIMVSDSHDNFNFELFETGEENQSEHEESQEELADDDFKNEFMYSGSAIDSKVVGQFVNYKQLSDIIFSDPTSPPPEFI